jgi:hypothetical protein
MTKLESIIARIKQLPAERQDHIAAEIEFMLDHDYGESLLTKEQWAEVEAALNDPSEPTVPHEQVFARLRHSTK